MLSIICKKTDFRAQTLETKFQRVLLSNKWDRLIVYRLNDMLLGFSSLQNSNSLSDFGYIPTVTRDSEQTVPWVYPL